MEVNHPSQIDLGLDRVRAVAGRMGPLIDTTAPGRPRVITVAGTNGKGSCVAALEAMFIAAGQRVGAYTSPHLFSYNERVRIDAAAVDDASLCRAFEAVRAAMADISLTYFEFGTLAAFWLFAQADLDVWLLEVGLGGRLDAVNLIDADVAIITSIDLDHQDWLGDSREAIGREKAGVFRSGRAAICADPAAPASVGDYARQIQAQWLPVSEAWDFNASSDHWSWRPPVGCGAPALVDLPLPDLPLPSVAAALTAFALIMADLQPGGWPALRQAVVEGLEAARLPGRFERLRYRDIEVIFDVGHNPHAARWLATRLAQQPAPTRAVFAMMGDKDRDGVIAALASAIDDWYVGELGGNVRAAPSAALAVALCQQGLRVHTTDSVEEAWEAALRDCQPGQRILVFGSFFTVAALRSRVLDAAAA
jgi:dihydrofolate synthase/folylpolyglutamate synthase